MKAMAGTPTAGVLVRACGTSLREVAATVTDDGERLVLIETLEILKNAACAAQAELTAAYAASQRA